MTRGLVGRVRFGIDLVAGGRSKALVADRQAGMTHYIWRWRRTPERDNAIFCLRYREECHVCLGEEVQTEAGINLMGKRQLGFEFISGAGQKLLFFLSFHSLKQFFE